MGRWKRRNILKSKKTKLKVNDNNKNDGTNKNIRLLRPPSLTNTPSATQASSSHSLSSSQSSRDDRSSTSVSLRSHDDWTRQKESLQSIHDNRTDSPPAEVSISSTTTPLHPPTTKATKVSSTKSSMASHDPPKVTPLSTNSSLHSHPRTSKNTNISNKLTFQKPIPTTISVVTETKIKPAFTMPISLPMIIYKKLLSAICFGHGIHDF